MRGVLKYLIHAVVAAVILVGCATPTPPPEPVTLRFAFPTGDLDQNKRLVEQFTKSYPHIKVESPQPALGHHHGYRRGRRRRHPDDPVCAG